MRHTPVPTPKNFEFVSLVHFCTLQNWYKFLRCLNGWLTVIVDASSVAANKLSIVNVDSYIRINGRCYRDLKRLEKIRDVKNSSTFIEGKVYNE